MSAESDDHRYWKAAISHLPTAQQRDAAWEFFVNRFAGNAQAADTLSGTIMVMEAHGLYMLAFPKRFHTEAVAPLEAMLHACRESFDQFLLQQKAANSATVDAWEKSQQIAREALQTVEKFDEAVREGWKEVNTEKLVDLIHEELESTLLKPLASQCQQLEETTPAVTEAIEELVRSARQLRGFHFRGIFLGLLISFLSLTGACFWYLKQEHERKLRQEVRLLESTSSQNREAFEQLDLLGAKIRVTHPVDDRGTPNNEEYALVMEAGHGVSVFDSKKGKWAAIYFRPLSREERRQQAAP